MSSQQDKALAKRFDKQFLGDDGLLHDKYARDELLEFIRKEKRRSVTEGMELQKKL